MACAEEVVIGGTGHQEINQVFHSVSGGDGCTQDTFSSGSFAVLDEEAKPLLELHLVGELGGRQWAQHAARWASKSITGAVDEGMDISQRFIVFL